MLQGMLLLMTTQLEEMQALVPMRRRAEEEEDLEAGEITEEVEEGREEEALEVNIDKKIG